MVCGPSYEWLKSTVRLPALSNSHVHKQALSADGRYRANSRAESLRGALYRGGIAPDALEVSNDYRTDDRLY